MKKIFTLLLSLTLVIGALTGCGSNNANTENVTDENSVEASEETTSQSYQFTANYEESGEYSAYLSAAFLLDLNEDGTAVCDKYSYGNYDASDVSTNVTYYQSYLSGTWKEVDKDGVLCLQIKLATVDGSGNETYYAYDVDGVYSFDMTFPAVPGQTYTRTVTMFGAVGKVYTDDNVFVQDYKIEFVAPESVGTFADVSQDGTAYLQADGTVLVYAGNDKFAEGTWSKNTEGFDLTIDGDAIEVTMDGNKATFTYSRSLGGTFTTDYVFVCEDISLISDLEASETSAASTGGYTVLIDLGGNATTATLTLNEDGTAIFNAFTEIACTYEKIGSAVVLSAGTLEGYGEQIWGAVKHAYILNEDFTMTPVNNAYLAGELAFITLDDTNMKVEFPSYGMSREGFTYSLSEDGTLLTITVPSADDLGAFSQIWDASGALNWSIDGNTATKAE